MTQIANFFAENKHQVTICTWSGVESDDFYHLHGSVKREHANLSYQTRGFFQKILLSFKRILFLRKLLKKHPDLKALSFMDSTNVLLVLASMGLNVRSVISERTDPGSNPSIKPAWRLLRKFTYRFADAVVVQTKSAAKWVREECKVEPTVLPNPLRSMPRPIKNSDEVIISIGRLDFYKGLDLLLMAFVRVHEAFPSWTLIVLGDGPERENLLRLRDKLRLPNEKVQFVGRVNKVEDWLSRAGLFVLSSRIEGFPNALLEAMGMGLAVISTDCRSGPSEIIQDGVSGRLVATESVIELADAMIELIGDPKKRQALGKSALEVNSDYGEERILKKWKDLLFSEG
jgi:GalNAc-alpha-(1->4)-GalNAc-alpha-(1->3)-diNAcBac-PP-undecaprenol alpha-1,4-N-acetyl-D-galactosaminyltransferase